MTINGRHIEGEQKFLDDVGYELFKLCFLELCLGAVHNQHVHNVYHALEVEVLAVHTFLLSGLIGAKSVSHMLQQDKVIKYLSFS